MEKRMLIPLSLGLVALVLFAAWALLPQQESPAPSRPAAPVIQGQTDPTRATTPNITAPAETNPGETYPEAATLPTEPELPGDTEPSQTEPLQTSPLQTEPVQTEPPAVEQMTFPVLLEDGMLTVQSVFQFSGMNPDADLAFGENIAGLQITNTSDWHMKEAEITAVLHDGTELTFLAQELSPGMSAMVFSLEHGMLKDTALCAEVYGSAEFETGDPLRRDLVDIQVDGMEVTVKNVSGEDLTDLTIFCHGLLDESSFGGKAYTYRITSLSAGASTVVFAQDCILGMAQVTRVELGG